MRPFASALLKSWQKMLVNVELESLCELGRSARCKHESPKAMKAVQQHSVEKRCLVHLEGIYWRWKSDTPLIMMTQIMRSLESHQWKTVSNLSLCLPDPEAKKRIHVSLVHFYLSEDSNPFFFFLFFVCSASRCLFTCSCHAACWSHWSGSLTPSPACWWRASFPAAGSQVGMFGSEPAKRVKENF